LKHLLYLLSVFIFLGCSLPTVSSITPLKRVALVIGNQDYGENSLENSINDAVGIAKKLEDIGFEVILKKDVTLLSFYEALEQFKEKIEPHHTIAFFYFAGHGNTLTEKSREEYLMMTDKKQKTLMSIYRLYEFLDKAQARHNIVVIDACRDFQKTLRPIEDIKNARYIKNRNRAYNFRGNFRANITEAKGVSTSEWVIHDDNCSESFPRSTIVSYATMHNQMARDWSIYDEHHSPYTRLLIHYLDDEEIPIEEVFRRVRMALIKETNRQQMNLEENSLEKNVWLVPKKAEVAFAPPI